MREWSPGSAYRSPSTVSGAGCPRRVPDRAEGRGQEGVPLAQVGVDDRPGAPPLQRLVADPHACSCPAAGGGCGRRPAPGRARRWRAGWRPSSTSRRASSRAIRPGTCRPSRSGSGAGRWRCARTAGPAPAPPAGRRDQLRRLRVEQRHQVVGEQPQPLGLGGPAHRLGRVHHRGRVRPPVVGAEQRVEGFRGAREQARRPGRRGSRAAR